MNTIRDKIESAVKSLELEGFVYTDDEKVIFEKIANGDLMLDEGKAIFINELTEKYGSTRRRVDIQPDEYVLNNKLGIKNNIILNEYERKIVTFNIVSLRNKNFKKFSFDTLKRMHKEIFQDLYDWAGTIRNVNISKGNSFFCPAENIYLYARDIFDKLEKKNYLKGLTKKQFCQKAAELFGDINALHPFREGNGRTQRAFIYHLAKNAGYKLDLNKADKDRYMTASIESMMVSSKKMEQLINEIIEPLKKPKT